MVLPYVSITADVHIDTTTDLLTKGLLTNGVSLLQTIQYL